MKKIKRKKFSEKAGTFLLFEKLGRVVSEKIKKLFPKRKKGESGLVVLPGDLIEDRKKYGLYGFAMAVFIIGAVIIVISAAISKDSVEEVERPDFGEEKNIELSYGEGKGQTVRFPVSGKVPEDEELEKIFDIQFEKKKEKWLRKNESEDRVTSRLDLQTEDEYGIQYRFQSSDTDRITDFGSILTDDFPPDGTEIVYEIELSYGDFSKTYEWTIRLFSAGAELTAQERLLQKLEEENEKTKKEDTMILPKELDGEALSFRKKTTSVFSYLFALALLCGGILLLPYLKQKRWEEKRKKDFIRQYASMVSEINLLLRAGLSTRMAWQKIVRQYEEKIARKEGKKDYLHEEMKITLNELKSGTSEETAYRLFANRTKNHNYVRLTNLLIQNQKQGIAGIQAALENEVTTALEERKNNAIRKGEKAGTKLLFPMVVMLGVVIVLLVVPAFMSF